MSSFKIAVTEDRKGRDRKKPEETSMFIVGNPPFILKMIPNCNATIPKAEVSHSVNVSGCIN